MTETDRQTRGEKFAGAVGSIFGSLAGGAVGGFQKQLSPVAGPLYNKWQGQTGAPQAEPLIANEKAFGSVADVYMCVDAIATAGATVPLKLYRKTGEDRREWQEIGTHPILDVIEYPNPDAEESDFDLKETLLADWELSGNWYLYTQRNSDGLTERMYRLRPAFMKVVPSSSRRVHGYTMTVGGETTSFTREEIGQSKTFNPFSDLYGLSSLSAARLEITLDTQSLLWDIDFFKNNATPPAALLIPGKLTPDKKKQLQEGWDKGHKGPGKQHRLAILSGGADIKTLGIPQTDIDFLATRRFSREQIMAIFRVYPFIITVMEYSNYANAEAQTKAFWYNTMIPKLTKMQRALTRILCHPYDKSLVLEFDLTKVQALIEDALALANVDEKLTRSGVMTINERRRERGLPPVPWGDVAWMQIQYQPVSGPEMSFPGLSGKSAGDGSETRAVPVASAVKGRALYEGEVMKAGRELAWETVIAPSRGQFAKKVVGILGKQEEEVLAKINAEKRTPTEIRRWVQKRAEAKAEGAEITDALITDAARIEAEVWLFDYEYWQTGSIKAVHPTLLTAINEGGKFGLLELGLDMDFDLVDPLVQRELKLKEFVFSEEWNESTLLRLREELAQGIVNGENKPQLTERVSKVFGHEKKNAGVVAQTEVGSVSNAGAVEGYRQSGVVEGKQWHASGPNPRPDHIAANGQIVPLDQEFQVGGEGLRYPGDPNGRADNVCNCHCSVLPVVADVEG